MSDWKKFSHKVPKTPDTIGTQNVACLARVADGALGILKPILSPPAFPNDIAPSKYDPVELKSIRY